MKTVFSCAALVAAIAFASANAQADTLVDRGLPAFNATTPNLNNIAGSNRSNVAWVDSDPSTTLYGDNFMIGGTLNYNVNTIRVWTVGTSAPTGLSLLGGTGSGSIGVISNTATVTQVTYDDGENYETTSSGFRNIYQVDFAVSLFLNGATTYDFFINGSPTVPFLHASNAALSNSPQQGSDNTLLYLDTPSGNVFTWDSLGNGWDKSSDFNVQVLGEAAPLPPVASMGLTLLALVGAAALARKKVLAPKTV